MVVHRLASLNRFNRSRTRSISGLGILIPVFDFFWKAWITQISPAICKGLVEVRDAGVADSQDLSLLNLV
jgi:hypothetical protein